MDDSFYLIHMDRLMEFCRCDWIWPYAGHITVNDIADAVQRGIPETATAYGDMRLYPVQHERSRKWHIGRILHFVYHPEEIQGIEIDNESSGVEIHPVPIIVDGWHRYAAAVYLYEHGQLTTVACSYGGRMDVLAYLMGRTNKI